MDVREHALLVATSGVGYDWFQTGVWFVTTGGKKQDPAAGASLLKMGLDMAGVASGDRDDDAGTTNRTWHYPMGQFIDRFHAGDQPGLVMVQVSGNAYTTRAGRR